MPRKKETEKQKVVAALGESFQIEVSDEGLARVSELARMQHQASIAIAECEDDLKKRKEWLRQIAETDLPEMMKEVGLETFTTSDGLVVTRKDEVQCAIRASNKEAALQWLADNNFDGIVKTEIEMHFDKGDKAKAEKVVEWLRKKGLEVEVASSIHAQTLKAFVRERIADTESEIEFPLDLFGAYPYQVTTVKPKKK